MTTVHKRLRSLPPNLVHPHSSDDSTNKSEETPSNRDLDSSALVFDRICSTRARRLVYLILQGGEICEPGCSILRGHYTREHIENYNLCGDGDHKFYWQLRPEDYSHASPEQRDPERWKRCEIRYAPGDQAVLLIILLTECVTVLFLTPIQATPRIRN